MIIIIKMLTIIIMIKDKGNREEKEIEGDWERAIMYYYSTVTSKIETVIFTNRIFSAYVPSSGVTSDTLGNFRRSITAIFKML